MSTLKERKVAAGYTSQNREWEKRACAKCVHVDDRVDKTVCRKHEMRVSYFGLCRDFSGTVNNGRANATAHLPGGETGANTVAVPEEP
jgi:hypothetical protein